MAFRLSPDCATDRVGATSLGAVSDEGVEDLDATLRLRAGWHEPWRKREGDGVQDSGGDRHLPMIAVAVGVYIIGIAFTFYWSFTSSKLFPNTTFRRPRPVPAPVGERSLADRGPQHLDLRRAVDRLQPGVRLSARRLHGPAHPAGRPVPLDLPLSLRHVADRHRPHLAVDARPQSRHREHHPQSRLDELPFLAAGRSRHRDLRPGARGHLAGLGGDDGDPARRPSRRRRGDLEGGEGRRHSDLARLSVHRAADDPRARWRPPSSCSASAWCASTT